jgi:hypothetical protein
VPTPDQAAELLQLEERGPDLVRRCLTDETINRAIQMVASGFSPSDVAQALDLPWSREAHEESVEASLEGRIKVWECKTIRCRQKGKVSTADDAPSCPSCGVEMSFLMAIDNPEEISHMARVSVTARISDPLARTDRTRENAPTGRSFGEDDGDD